MTIRTRGAAVLLLVVVLGAQSGCATGSPRARAAADGAAKGAAVGAMGAGLGVAGVAIGTMPLGLLILPFAPAAMVVGAVGGAGVGAAVGAARASSAGNDGQVPATGAVYVASPTERAAKQIACQRRHLEFRSDWRDRLPEYRACLAD